MFSRTRNPEIVQSHGDALRGGRCAGGKDAAGQVQCGGQGVTWVEQVQVQQTEPVSTGVCPHLSHESNSQFRIKIRPLWFLCFIVFLFADICWVPAMSQALY